MKNKILALLLGSAVLLTSGLVQARDDVQTFPIQEAMTSNDAPTVLEGVKFYFGDAAHPQVVENLGNYQSNKKTNAFMKDKKEACEWAFLSAMISLRDRAISKGGNAVINVSSNYHDSVLSSSTEYECGVGFLMVGVTFTGDVVKIR